jgi:phosphohistidine phosphatase
MLVYLIRHAHAVDATEDAARPLSGRGREQVRSLGALLKTSGAFQPTEIWHSPLVRSRETAERLVKRLRLLVPLAQVPGLEPEDDPRATAQRIHGAPAPLAIVGHEPQLSALASLLIAGKPAPPVFVLKKCAALCLEGEGRFWMVRWMLSPEVVP